MKPLNRKSGCKARRRAVKALLICILILLPVALALPAMAATEPVSPADVIGGGPGSQDPNITVSINGEGSDLVRILIMLTLISLVPSLLVMLTSFTRIIIVFSLLRNALGLQQTPPNQVLIGLALILSLFVMSPVLTEINESAYEPYTQGEIGTDEFLDKAQVPLKDFMLKQTRQEDMNMFLNLAKKERPETPEDYTMDVVIPAFMTSEIKRAFTIGFFIFIPFLIIDMVVASALMSMGMMMLPPATISLPFKLMLFVLVDGWGLLIQTIIASYQR